MGQNEEAKKIQIVLSKDAIDVIDTHSPSERKKGEWVSTALIDYARIMSGVGDMGSESDGLLERIDNRLARIEKQLAVIIAERQ